MTVDPKVVADEARRRRLAASRNLDRIPRTNKHARNSIKKAIKEWKALEAFYRALIV